MKRATVLFVFILVTIIIVSMFILLPNQLKMPPGIYGNYSMDMEKNVTNALKKSVESPPVLKNLGVNFEAWNKETNKAGDFLFINNPILDKIFIEFGAKVPGEKAFGRKPKLLPEMAFLLPLGTKVFSTVNGTVTYINILWSRDYGVNIKTSENSEWMVSHEHLTNLYVKEGDKVIVGQVIGEVSPSEIMGLSLKGIGFTELAVWKGGGSEKDIVKICPFSTLDENLKPLYEGKIKRLAKDWEEFKGRDIFNESAWILPGCFFEKLTEFEALNPLI